jgi:hypothetical protein
MLTWESSGVVERMVLKCGTSGYSTSERTVDGNSVVVVVVVGIERGTYRTENKFSTVDSCQL